MKPQLTDVLGIGPSTARLLEEQGIRSVTELAKAGTDKVVAAPGFGQIRAAEVVAAAAALLAAAGEPKAAKKKAASSQGTEKALAKEKDGKGKEKNKKGKEKNKKKKAAKKKNKDKKKKNKKK